jgi:hypothetical protein
VEIVSRVTTDSFGNKILKPMFIYLSFIYLIIAIAILLVRHFVLHLKYQLFVMTAILIDKKKYVLIPEKDYQALQKKAALKSKPEKTFTVEEARIYSKKLIRKWAAEK